MVSLNGAGVPCTVGSCSEVYLERAFTDAGLGPPTRLAVARELGETSVALPIHHTLSDEYVDWLGERVAGMLGEATGR
jgi:dTDP-4-amino-4,6-dideoxygalactose transaminase